MVCLIQAGTSGAILQIIKVAANMTSTSNTQETQGQRMPELYGLDASCIKDSGRQLLREYSEINDEEINGHVEAIVS